MFEISTSPIGRKAASALTVLAAIGASGMVADVSSAAVTELEPTLGARGARSSYMGQGNPEHWSDWLAETDIQYHFPPNGPGFAKWAIDFGAGVIENAKYRIDANGAGTEFGLPPGCTLNFSLVTEAWDPLTPDPNQFGPDHGSTLGVDMVEVLNAAGGDIDADITTLLQTWQANPGAYYGVRFAVSGGGDVERGGVIAPGGSFTANLLLDQAIPEPASLGMIALGGGGILLSRRKRR